MLFRDCCKRKRQALSWFSLKENHSSRSLPDHSDCETAPVLEPKGKLWVIGGIALLTPAVLLVHGYHPLADDGAVYVTGIKKLANPGLYQSDAVFALSPTHLSVFAHLLSPLLRWVPLPGLLLVCQLTSIFLFLLGSWRVAEQLFSTSKARWGAVLLAACCFTLPVAGTSLSIMDPYVTARSFSTPLSLFALAAVLEEDWAWSIFWLVLAALLHPLMAVYSAIATLTVAGCQRRLWRPLYLVYGLGWLLCAAIFVAQPPGLKRVCEYPAKRTAGPPVTLRSASEERSVEFGTKGFGGLRPSFSAHVRWCEHGAPVRSCGDRTRLEGGACGIPAIGAGIEPKSLLYDMPAYSRGFENPLSGTKDPHRADATTAYSRAALSRSYFFLSSWKWYEYPGLLIPLLLLGAAGSNKHASWRTRALAIAATLMGGCALVVSLCFVHRSGSLLLARLQVLRGFQFVYIAGVLLAGGLLAKLRQRTITALCLLLAGALFLGQRLTYPESNHVEWPGMTPRNRWQQAFLWIRSGTPDNAIFALDNDYMENPGEDAQGFRASAERSAVADWYKDGGIASNFPQAAIPWWQGSNATEHLNSATDEQRLARLKPLGATWIVLPAQANTGFPCPFINPRVRVCRVAVSPAEGAK